MRARGSIRSEAVSATARSRSSAVASTSSAHVAAVTCVTCPARAERARRGPVAAFAMAGGTRTVEQTDTSTRAELARPWHVIVHDDPVTPMSYVVHVFMKVFGYEQIKAQRLMLEVHNTGRAIVWTGGRETAELFAQKLHARQLRATIEQSED